MKNNPVFSAAVLIPNAVPSTLDSTRKGIEPKRAAQYKANPIPIND